MSKKSKADYSTPFLDASMMELAVPRLGGTGVMGGSFRVMYPSTQYKEQYSCNINYNSFNNIESQYMRAFNLTEMAAILLCDFMIFQPKQIPHRKDINNLIVYDAMMFIIKRISKDAIKNILKCVSTHGADSTIDIFYKSIILRGRHDGESFLQPVNLMEKNNLIDLLLLKQVGFCDLQCNLLQKYIDRINVTFAFKIIFDPSNYFFKRDLTCDFSKVF